MADASSALTPGGSSSAGKVGEAAAGTTTGGGEPEAESGRLTTPSAAAAAPPLCRALATAWAVGTEVPVAEAALTIEAACRRSSKTPTRRREEREVLAYALEGAVRVLRKREDQRTRNTEYGSYSAGGIGCEVGRVVASVDDACVVRATGRAL
jgi:hypothetical protein